MYPPSVLSMRWADVLFAHWAVDPAVVSSRLPAGLEPDTYDGEAYLSVVAFRMEDIGPRGLPLGPSFPEFNLRTYVEGDAGPGIYFFNLDADARLSVSVARRFFRLPYYRADATVEEADDGILYRSHRVHAGEAPAAFDATASPTGTAAPPEPDSLAEFLTERYRFYADVGGSLYIGPVSHPRWPLQAADLDVRTNTFFAANDFDHPGGDPLVHYSPGVDVRAEPIRPVDDSGFWSLPPERRRTLA